MKKYYFICHTLKIFCVLHHKVYFNKDKFKQEELDIKTLRIQNKHFAENYTRLKNQLIEQKDEVELMSANEKANAATLSLINRSWEQVCSPNYYNIFYTRGQQIMNF